MSNRYILLFLVCLLGFQGCYKDVNNEAIVEVPDKPIVEVEAHITAVAMDLSGRRIAGVLTSFANQVTGSDLNGYTAFDVDYVPLDKESVTYGKSGFFTLSRSVLGFAGETTLHSLPMLAVEHSQRFITNNDASFVINNILQVDIKPESLIFSRTGEAYSGSYKIEGKRLSTKESSFLYGHRSPMVYQHELTNHIILPHTTVLLNLKSDNDEELQLIEPCLITLTMSAPSPDDFVFTLNQNGVFEKVDYIYIDGKLMVEAVANKILVIGSLQKSKLISGHITTIEQNSLDHVTLDIQQSQYQIQYKTRTSSNGNYRIWVAADPFYLKISSICGHEILESPLDARLISGDIDIQLDPLDYFVYSGQVLDCGLDPITNGYLLTKAKEGEWLTPISYDGNFKAMVPYCQQEQVNVECFNFVSGEKVQSFNLFTSSSSHNNIVYACPTEENTEASVFIDSDIIHFNKCSGETNIDNGNLKGLAFTVSNDRMNEVHRFIRNTNGTQDYWFSTSSLLDDQFKIITIGGQPSINTYSYQGIPYKEVTFNSVLFEDATTGDRSRGRLQYIIVGK